MLGTSLMTFTFSALPQEISYETRNHIVNFYRSIIERILTGSIWRSKVRSEIRKQRNIYKQKEYKLNWFHPACFADILPYGKTMWPLAMGCETPTTAWNSSCCLYYFLHLEQPLINSTFVFISTSRYSSSAIQRTGGSWIIWSRRQTAL